MFDRASSPTHLQAFYFFLAPSLGSIAFPPTEARNELVQLRNLLLSLLVFGIPAASGSASSAAPSGAQFTGIGDDGLVIDVGDMRHCRRRFQEMPVVRDHDQRALVAIEVVL